MYFLIFVLNWACLWTDLREVEIRNMHIESASTWLCQNTIGFCGKVNKVVHGIHHIELEVHSGCCCKPIFFLDSSLLCWEGYALWYTLLPVLWLLWATTVSNWHGSSSYFRITLLWHGSGILSGMVSPTTFLQGSSYVVELLLFLLFVCAHGGYWQNLQWAVGECSWCQIYSIVVWPGGN